jgi:hypothetical protein
MIVSSPGFRLGRTEESEGTEPVNAIKSGFEPL